MKHYRIVVAALLAVMAGDGHDARAQAPVKPVELAGGASAISETHGDWAVNCQVIRDTRICSFSFQQFESSSNQRVFAIELSPRNGSAIGHLALPFGLALARGVSLRIDDRAVEGNLPFSTCIIAGCLVPLNFDGRMLANLQNGATLTLGGFVLENGAEINFTVPLRGFTSAMRRAAQLLAN